MIALDQIELTTQRLDPVEAEVRASGLDVADGRLIGPRCEYASTVEIAYYFRPVPAAIQRVIVPEPSLWEPQTPFLYQALLQTRNGSTITKHHGLRSVQLAPSGLRVNGRTFTINGAIRHELSDAAELRAAGVNTIVCPASFATASLWDDADRLGFFVLGIVTRDADSLHAARSLRGHASCLGWLLASADVLEPESLQTRPGREPLLGLLTDAAPAQIPAWVQFLAGPSADAMSPLPWLNLADQPDAAAAPMGIVRR